MEEANRINQALDMIGTRLHTNGQQALVLSNNTLVDKLYDMTNVNRDIDDAWVQKMKAEVLHMADHGQNMTVTVGIDVRDIRAIMAALQANATEEERRILYEGFKVRVYDGQHRLKALSELYYERPHAKYEFYALVYIIQNNEDEKLLLEKLNTRREFTQKDQQVVDARKMFLDVWDQVTGERNETRLCVRNIRTTKRIRSPHITEALSKMSASQMREKLFKIAENFRADFTKECETPKFVGSAVYKVIADTKLYQLVCYYRSRDDSWLEQLCSP